MRVLIQRVNEASVKIEENRQSHIKQGSLVLVGIEDEDDENDIDWIIKKIINLRIFNDENSVMNKSIKDINGEILVVSQFTLHASTKKGNRPSYIRAAKPSKAVCIYDKFCTELANQFGKEIQTGVFGANMQIKLINDGPVTIWIDSKQKE